MKLLFTRIVFLLIVILSLIQTDKVNAQQTNLQQNKFVQFYVIGMTDVNQSRAVDQFMRAQSNILISRADPNSRIYFAIFPATAGFDENTFIAWFAGMGYQISCYREGIHGTDRVFSKENYRCD